MITVNQCNQMEETPWTCFSYWLGGLIAGPKGAVLENAWCGAWVERKN